MKRLHICGFSQQNEYPLKALTLLSTNMSSDFSSAVQKLSKRILKKSKIVIFFLSFFLLSSSSPMRLTREPQGVHGQKRYQNVSLSLARCCGCLKMPGDEQKKKVENHACLVGPYQNFCQICYTELLQANTSQLLRTSIEMYGTYTTKISYSLYIGKYGSTSYIGMTRKKNGGQ